MNQNKSGINFTYILVTLLAVAATWLVHEFAHWGVGELLGNEMVMTLNTCYPIAGNYLADWHEVAISAAGPAITILQAFIIYFLLQKGKNRLLFPFLLTALYMRTLAGIMNFISLNDEGRISEQLGLGFFTVPFIVFGILFYLVYKTVTQEELKSKVVVITTLLIMLFSSLIILTDQAMHIIVL